MSATPSPRRQRRRTTDDVRAADGRRPGRRGHLTRTRLLEVTEALLATTSYRDLRVVDIAREAGTSPATFYQYFSDVTEAVLVLGERVHAAAAEVAEMAAGDWTDPATAPAVVAAFESFWDAHGSVMRVVDLAAYEGDDRFRTLRTHALNAITEALRLALMARGHPASTAKGTAGVLVGMLAHVTAHREGFEKWGVSRKALDASLARVLRVAMASDSS